MDNATASRLTDDIISILAANDNERVTVTDLMAALRNSFRGGAERGDCRRRWTLGGGVGEFIYTVEQLGFAVYYSTNERNQRAQFVSLTEVHPYAPAEPEAAPEGFVILGHKVDHWVHSRKAAVSRYTSHNRRNAYTLADAKVYKTRKGAEAAAAKAVKFSRRLSEGFDPAAAVITAAEFIALNA